MYSFRGRGGEGGEGIEGEGRVTERLSGSTVHDCACTCRYVLRNKPDSLEDLREPVLEAFSKFLDLLAMVQVWHNKDKILCVCPCTTVYVVYCMCMCTI